MKLAIIGSRNFPKLNLVENYVKSLPKDQDIIILTLDAKGVHNVANWIAKKEKFLTTQITVHWKEYGGRAFYVALDKLIEDCDELTVFFDEHDSGSRKIIEDAYSKYKTVRTIKEDGSITEIGQLFFDEARQLQIIADDDIPF